VSRPHALAIFRAALRAADPEKAVLAHVATDGKTLRVDQRRYRLTDFDRVQVIGAGKASARMAQAIERLLGKRVTGGWINVPDGTKARLRKVRLHESGHPVPDERGVAGAERIAQIASESGPRDLLICVISGGASALMPLPAPGITLAKKKSITKRLLASGATIHEINTIRKHLSAIKGGHLAALAAPATVIALILLSPRLIDASVWISSRLDELFASASTWLATPLGLVAAALFVLAALATKWARIW